MSALPLAGAGEFESLRILGALGGASGTPVRLFCPGSELCCCCRLKLFFAGLKSMIDVADEAKVKMELEALLK
jgi:hypothetical protein